MSWKGWFLRAYEKLAALFSRAVHGKNRNRCSCPGEHSLNPVLFFTVLHLIGLVPGADLDDIPFRISDETCPLSPGFGGRFQ